MCWRPLSWTIISWSPLSLAAALALRHRCHLSPLLDLLHPHCVIPIYNPLLSLFLSLSLETSSCYTLSASYPHHSFDPFHPANIYVITWTNSCVAPSTTSNTDDRRFIRVGTGVQYWGRSLSRRPRRSRQLYLTSKRSYSMNTQGCGFDAC